MIEYWYPMALIFHWIHHVFINHYHQSYLLYHFNRLEYLRTSISIYFLAASSSTYYHERIPLHCYHDAYLTNTAIKDIFSTILICIYFLQFCLKVQFFAFFLFALLPFGQTKNLFSYKSVSYFIHNQTSFHHRVIVSYITYVTLVAD